MSAACGALASAMGSASSEARQMAPAPAGLLASLSSAHPGSASHTLCVEAMHVLCH